MSPFHYLPLTPGFFSIFISALIVLFIGLAVLDLLRHAYLNLGVSPRTAMSLLNRLPDRQLFQHPDCGPAG